MVFSAKYDSSRMDLEFVRMSCFLYFVVELYSVCRCLESYFGNFPYKRCVVVRYGCYHMNQIDDFRMSSTLRANYYVVYYFYRGCLIGVDCLFDLGHCVGVLICRYFGCHSFVGQDSPCHVRVDM